jgi:hypothetical protein
MNVSKQTKSIRSPAPRLHAASRASVILHQGPAVVRLQPHELVLLDKWMIEQTDTPENPQAAVRKLITTVCGKMKEK